MRPWMPGDVALCKEMPHGWVYMSPDAAVLLGVVEGENGWQRAVVTDTGAPE